MNAYPYANHALSEYSQHYGVTVTWNVLLVLNEPDVAVTVMV